MEWKVSDDDRTFDAILDRAEREGPQRVSRRGKRFLVLVEDAHQGDNPLIRAFLDEPEFDEIEIEKTNLPMREPEL